MAVVAGRPEEPERPAAHRWAVDRLELVAPGLVAGIVVERTVVERTEVERTEVGCTVVESIGVECTVAASIVERGSAPNRSEWEPEE